MKKNLKKQIIAVILCVSYIISVAPAMAEEEKDIINDIGFINPLDEPLPTIGADGFINPLDKPLPQAGTDGFIDKIEVDLPTKRSDGFIIAPEKVMPERGDDGFIIPLEGVIPEISNGKFINPVSKQIPDTEISGFLKDIPEADERAKVITTADELASIRSGRYRLGCDIDLSDYNGGVWYPITPSGSVQLDGQGYKIYNLNIPKESKEIYAGLFGSCYYSVKITNLALVNNIEGKGITVFGRNNEKIYAAGFVANGNVILDNCYSNVSVTIDGAEDIWGDCYAGGLVGYSNAVVKNCYYDGVIDVVEKGKTRNVYSGGIMGAGTINVENSFNRGSIYSGSGNLYIGGTEQIDGSLAGGILASGGGYITGCVNTGFVSAQVVGGLVGHAGTKLTVKDSCNMGEVSLFTQENYSVTDEFFGGGLIGNAQNVIIENSFNNGRITKTSASEKHTTEGFAGGLVGNTVKADILHSYNAGDIIYDAELLPDFVEYVGGLVGHGEEVTVSGCYNSGTLGSTMKVGGIMGYGSLSIDYSCNYGEIFGACIVGGILGGGEIDAESCVNKGKITFSFYEEVKDYELRNYAIGGIIGGHAMGRLEDISGYSSTINNCVNEGEIYSEYLYNYAYEYHDIGGISGNAKVQITSCCNIGNITIETADVDDIRIAGITAFSTDDAKITNSYNAGKINTAGGYAAGITTAGATGYSADEKIYSIEGCYNTGDIINNGIWSTYLRIFGIGFATETIKDCYNMGACTGKGYGIGSASRIYNCYNTGSGFDYGIGNGENEIIYCYNQKAVSSYGIGESLGDISYCYNNGDCASGIGSGNNMLNCFNTGALSGVRIYGIGCAKKTITNCYNTGSGVWEYSNSNNSIFYGIGDADSIVDCYNMGSSRGDTRGMFFGIGWADTKIERCFNKGSITNTGVTGYVNEGTFGIGKSLKISECYNTGHLSGTNVLGIGEASSFVNCFNSGNITSALSEYSKRVAGIGTSNRKWYGNGTGDTGDKLTIVNCYNTGNVNNIKESEDSMVAGIVVSDCSYGYTYNMEITSCYNTGNVTNDLVSCGIVGGDYYSDSYEGKAKISNCFNKGKITAGTLAVGIASATTIVGCYNEGEVSGNTAYGITYAGDVINCYNSGYISSTDSAAGIGGTSISNSYNTGSISVFSSTEDVVAGGIALFGTKSIIDCHNRGNVMVQTTALPDEEGHHPAAFCGGLVGLVKGYPDSDERMSITNSRNHGNLTAYSSGYVYVGGIVSYGRYYDSYDESIGNYTVPTVRIDDYTYSTGIRHYNCKAAEYDENGELIRKYGYSGEIAGDGRIGTNILYFPEAIELKGRNIICIDEVVEYKAVLTPSEGVDKTLVWTSTDPSVAEVDADGNVTGIGEGKAVITATTKNGLTASREIEVVADGIIIEVMGFVEDKPQEPYLLPGATVDVGGVVKITDENGIAVFKKKELPDKASENVVVSCGEDYVPSEKLLPLLTYSGGMKKFNFALKYRSENIYITKAQLKLDGKFDDLIGVSTVVGIPLFKQDGTVNDNSYSFNVEMDWNRCTDNIQARKIYLCGAESGKLVSLEEGVNSVAFAKNFEVGEPIKVIAKTLDNEGNEVRVEKVIGLKVRIIDFKLDMPESPEIEVEGPNWLKNVEDNLGLRLSLDDIDDYGGNIYYKNGILKIRLEMKDNTTDDHKNRIKKMSLIKNANPVDVGIYGEISIPIHEDGQGQWSGMIGATTIGVNADYEDEEEIVKLLEAVYHFSVGTIPLFISFTLSGGATASMGIGGQVYDAYFDGNMTGKARGAIRGGVGRKYSDNFEVTFGPTGMLTLVLPFDFKAYGLVDSSEFTFEPSLEGKLLAELIVDTKLVDFNGELDIGSFEWDKNGFRWKNITGDNGVKLMSNKEVSGLKLKNIGRDYLENGGGFRGNSGIMLMRNNSLERDVEIIYENTIKSADASVCEIDGRTCLIYTYDNLLRDEDNGLTAMYTIKTDGGWSEPDMLWDDGTIDSAPVADGKFVAWRDKKSELAGDVTLEELFKADEISAAVYNGSSFDTVRLTDNDVYDFGVKVASNGDRAIVAWLSNDEADFTSTMGKTSLNYSIYDGGWSDVITVSDIGTVPNINVSYVGDTPKIVYKNADNEFYCVVAGNTSEKLLENIGRYAFSEVGGKDITAYFDEENILHIMSGADEVKTVETGFIGNENPIIATNSQTASVFWIEEDGIYYLTNASGEWSEKLQLVKSSEGIQKLDATFIDENNYFVSYFESDGTVTNLKSVNAGVGKDLSIKSIAFDEEAYRQDSNIEYSLTLFNNGEIASNGGTVYVYENAHVISNYDFNGLVMPGETFEISGTVAEVDLSKKHNYTFEIVSDGDYNTSNNTRNLSVGIADVRLQDGYFTVDELGRENLVIEVLNDGNVIINDAIVKVYKNSVESETLYDIKLGSIKPGEYAPIILDEVQDTEAIYYITVESDEDEKEYNNMALIGFERIEEVNVDNKPLEFDKTTRMLKFSADKSNVMGDIGECIIAVYDQNGAFKNAYFEEIDASSDVITMERVIENVSDGDKIKLMLWEDIITMHPVSKPFTTIVMP